MDERDELQEIRQLLAQLTRRVYDLEQRTGTEQGRYTDVPAPAGPAPSSQIVAPPPRVETARSPLLEIQRRVKASSGGTADREGLERRIGSQWLNRIGIIAVLIGVAYFLKFAFDSEWIGPASRVGIGLVAGVAVVLWSERFRGGGYALFSYSLKAVGIGVLYLSLWASVHVYQLMPVPVAFVGMVAVTATTAWMAMRQDAEVLAAMALLGGFLTPLLLWLGENHDIELFAYLVLLDVASLSMVAVRRWQRLLLGSFVGSVVVYAAWYFEYFRRENLVSAAIFVSLLWAIFAVAPLFTSGAQSAEYPRGSRAPFVLALVNAAACFVELYAMLEFSSQHDWSGWTALLLAVSYAVLAWILNSQPVTGGDSPMPWLHAGVAAAFVTVFIALKLESEWVTFGWLTEAAALQWLATRERSRALGGERRTGAELSGWLAATAVILSIARILLVSDRVRYTLIFNQRFASYAYAIAVLILIGYTSRAREAGTKSRSAMVVVLAINLLALLAFHFELRDYFDRLATAAANLGAHAKHSAGPELRSLAISRAFSYSAVWMVYGALLMVGGFWKRWALLRWQAIVLIGVTIVKVFTYDVSALDRGFRIASFFALGVILLGISFFYQRDWLRQGNG